MLMSTWQQLFLLDLARLEAGLIMAVAGMWLVSGCRAEAQSLAS